MSPPWSRRDHIGFSKNCFHLNDLYGPYGLFYGLNDLYDLYGLNGLYGLYDINNLNDLYCLSGRYDLNGIYDLNGPTMPSSINSISVCSSFG